MQVENTKWRIYSNKRDDNLLITDTPTTNPFWQSLSRVKYDNSVIIYYPKDEKFTPIVLRKRKISIENDYSPREFYRDLCKVLDLEVGNHTGVSTYYSCFRETKTRYSWGCRDFRRYQLLTIKREMEAFYPPEKLGIKK